MSKNAWLYIYAYNILYQYIIRLKIYQESLKRIFTKLLMKEKLRTREIKFFKDNLKNRFLEKPCI